MTKYQIKKINKGEFDILIPLMLDCFGMHVDIEYFKWKFLDNPAGVVEGYVALSDTNEVAAYYGVIPEYYSVNGEVKTIYQSCDPMTHSSHRRKGLFKKLALHCYNELKVQNKLFVIGFSGIMSTPGFIKFGFKQLFNMKYYFIFNVPSVFPIQKNENVHILTDINELESAILNSNVSSKVHSHKTLEVFKWRVSNPSYSYKFLAFHDGNCYSSYLCYYELDDKIILFDFFFSTTAIGKKLIKSLKKIMKDNRMKGIISFVQENSYFSQVLKNVGFWNNPFSKGPLSTKVPFIFYANENDLSSYEASDQWLVNSFDHDAM